MTTTTVEERAQELFKKWLKEQKNGNKNNKSRRNTEKELLVAMIIDASGSMLGLTQATISGFNEYLKDRKKENPKTLLSLTLFNTQRDIRYVATPVVDVKELTPFTYQASGGTALNDAIGTTVLEIEKQTGVREKVLVVIMTDGMENSSTDFTRAQIAELVNRKEDEGWKFVFFGANMDAFQEASTMGIAEHRAVNYIATNEGTAKSYSNISQATSLYQAGADETTWSNALKK